jgi:putative aldouronate transport system permease protein
MSQAGRTVKYTLGRRAGAAPAGTRSFTATLARDVRRDTYLYLMLLPGILFFLVFNYVPMYGVVIAFKEFSIFKGVARSPWAGMLQFERLFRAHIFPQVLRNTLLISFYKLLFGFPAPLLLALLLNEMRLPRFKRFTQTIMYIPHFVSWVIMVGLVQGFLSPSNGFINDIVRFFGGSPIHFLADRNWFRPIVVISDIYKNIGWGTIIYLAAFSGVSVELYEAAMLDGASRLRQALAITLPSIRNVVVILLILNLGNVLNAGFEQIFLLYSPPVYEVGDIIDTYVYRKGIVEANYSLGTAAGLFKSLISLVLIVGANSLAKRLGDEGVW